ELVQRARVFVAHAYLFRVCIGNALVTLDNRLYGRFALGQQARQLLAVRGDLAAQLLGFGAAIGMRGGGALAFASKSFGLLSQFFDRLTELPAQLVQSLS